VASFHCARPAFAFQRLTFRPSFERFNWEGTVSPFETARMAAPALNPCCHRSLALRRTTAYAGGPWAPSRKTSSPGPRFGARLLRADTNALWPSGFQDSGLPSRRRLGPQRSIYASPRPVFFTRRVIRVLLNGIHAAADRSG